MAEKQRFRTTIEQARGPGATVALVAADVVPGLGGVKQKRFFGWVNGVEFQTTTFPYKGELYVGVPKAARVAAGLVGWRPSSRLRSRFGGMKRVASAVGEVRG